MSLATPRRVRTYSEEWVRRYGQTNAKELVIDLSQANVHPAGNMISSYRNLRPWSDAK